jgi:4-hydroxybenzoate polyprenyltransferase
MLGPIAWLGLAAGIQMLGALLFFHVPIDFILIFSAVFITSGIYLINRFTDEEDCYNYPDQKFYFQRRSNYQAIAIFLIAFSVLVLAVTGRLVPWHVYLIMGGVLYSISVIPILKNDSLHFIRLKDILFVKNLVVSIFWGMSSFVIAGGQIGAIKPDNRWDLFILIAAFCLTTLINTVSCDVRDSKGDGQAGVKTLATCLGKNAVGCILLCLGTLASLFVGIGCITGKIGWGTTLLFVSAVIWTGLWPCRFIWKKCIFRS